MSARGAAAALLTVACAVLVGAILVLPGDPVHLVPAAFVRVPIEGVVGAALLAVTPARPRRVLAAVAGVLLAALGLLKVLDLGFRTALARPFDPVSDWVLLGSAQEFLRGTVGGAGAVAAVVVAAVAVVVLLVTAVLAVTRLGARAARHRRATTAVAAVLGVTWLVAGTAGDRLVPGVPLAAADGVTQLGGRVAGVPAAVLDRRTFAAEIADDAHGDLPGDRLLTALRGKDVVFAVVESYGRSAVEDPGMAEHIGPVLDDGQDRLDAAGFAARSGFLTAPVSGGGSWLSHATLFSGLRVDTQRRHDQLVTSPRRTLISAFRDAGWETTAVMPGTTRAWPEAAFYGHQRAHTSHADGLGYRGPSFSWSPMPDQYVLDTFSRLEHDRPDRGPLVAEIALTSSHAPWAPVPPLLPWDAIGDGSVYHAHAGGQRPFESIFTGDPATVRADYLDATGYALRSLLGWVERSGDDRLVVVVVGDHQPGAVVTGPGAGLDVPISVVTRDRAVLDRVGGWGWDAGLRPSPAAPVWPMHEFRDRFLDTFDGADPSGPDR